MDPRVHFLLITIIVPLVLSFIMLIFSKPFYVIAWFFVLLSGVGVFVAGVVITLLDLSVANSDIGINMLLAGGVCTGMQSAEAARRVQRRQSSDFRHRDDRA